LKSNLIFEVVGDEFQTHRVLVGAAINRN